MLHAIILSHYIGFLISFVDTPMLELSSLRKNKVTLADYNCQQDIDNRMALSDCSTFELEVLEEILFSPLKISFSKLMRSVGCSDVNLMPILKKLAKTGLLTIQDDSVIVDKELRKYFEFQMIRFSPDFKPDMEFLSNLLRKVPIHHLPAWYSIPRTSNNIFESILEKYLLSPQIFQRYLLDLSFADPKIPMINGVIADLFAAPDFKLYSSDVIGKYNLTRRDFEEIMLLLEFNFIGCVSYEKEEDHWIEIITPFYEWREYLRFLKATETPPIKFPSKPTRTRESDFAFIEDMSSILKRIEKKPLPLPSWKPGVPLPKGAIASELDNNYLGRVASKLILVELASFSEGKLHFLKGSESWLTSTLENRALHLYRHPRNRILNPSISPKIGTERNIREAEKSLRRILHGEWVYFEEFFKGVLVTLSETSVIMLKKTGKSWHYSPPVYSEDEKKLVKATIFEWLFEAGLVAIGTCKKQDCFMVTPFGRFFFDE
jgi:hypothetical protein